LVLGSFLVSFRLTAARRTDSRPQKREGQPLHRPTYGNTTKSKLPVIPANLFPGQASSFWTTFPLTSVSRNSRPWNR
jgi:hypothetical protein